MWWWPLDVVFLVPYMYVKKKRENKTYLRLQTRRVSSLYSPWSAVASVSRTFFPVIGRVDVCSLVVLDEHVVYLINVTTVFKKRNKDLPSGSRA